MNIIVRQDYMTNNIPTPPVPEMNWCSLECYKRP